MYLYCKPFAELYSVTGLIRAIQLNILYYDSLFAIHYVIWPRTLFLNSKTFLSTSNQIKKQKRNVVMIPTFNWISVHIFKLGETNWLVNSDKENKNKTKKNPNYIWNWTHVHGTELAHKSFFCCEESFFIRVNTLVPNQNTAIAPTIFWAQVLNVLYIWISCMKYEHWTHSKKTTSSFSDFQSYLFLVFRFLSRLLDGRFPHLLL